MDTKNATAHRWQGILPLYGLTDPQLSGKHTACPICGGKDRFRFDDKDGRGTYFCNVCGAGDGFDLLMRLTGKSFKQIALEIDVLLGNINTSAPSKPEKSFLEIRAELNRMISDAVCDIGNPYLFNRGITVKPNVCYRHRLEHWDGSIRTFHPAMLGIVVSPSGRNLAIHRTYLTKDGCKADVEPNKKLTRTLAPIAGAAIRLFPHGEVLGVAEGIETACAAYQLTGIPTWSVISASGMRSFIVPDGINRLVIFADNDENQVGQHSAFALVARCTVPCEVRVPQFTGTDWADYLPDPRKKK